MAKEMGDVVRFERATMPKSAAFWIVVLAVVTVVNAILFILTVQLGYNDPMKDQTMQAILLGNVLLGLAIILMIYRRFFMDDLLIVKKRHPKYEDFLDKYDIE